MKLKTFIFPNGQIAYGTEHVHLSIDNMEPEEVQISEHNEHELNKFFADPQKHQHLVPHPTPKKQK